MESLISLPVWNVSRATTRFGQWVGLVQVSTKTAEKISHPALPGCFRAAWGSRIPGLDVLDGGKDAPVCFLVPRPLRVHYLLYKHGSAWMTAVNRLLEATVCLLLVMLVLFPSVSRAVTDLHWRVTLEADQAEMELNHLGPAGGRSPVGN